MRKWLWLCLTSLFVLQACTPANGPKSAAADTAASSQGEAPAGWEQTVAAARREGKVVVSGPTRELWRKVLTSFEQDYPGIQVEYVGANSRDFWPRIFRERELGQYLWDLRVGGPDPEVYEAKDRGALDPVRPLLWLPEVVDAGKWLGGIDGMFFDKDKKYVLGFVSMISFMAYVNRDQVPESELSSMKDLTQPRWKGKIAIQDPRGGAGLNSLEMLLEVYGEGILRDILKNQDVVVSNDVRQVTEWAIRGRYPIAIGLVPDAFAAFQEEGLKLNIKPIPDSGHSLSTGTGGIQVLNRAPHPNAMRVYVNWLLTRAVQTRLSGATKQNSRRLDVPVADPGSVPDPRQLASYVSSQAEEMLSVRQRAQVIARELLP